MAGQNIDKEKFSRNCEKWVNETDKQVTDWLYSKYLHNDVLTLIGNVTYHWDMADPRLTREDVEAELLMHLIVKREKFRPYSGNFYNIIFTALKRKFYDILRSYRDENESLGKLHDFCNHNLDTIEINNITHDLEEQPEQPKPEPKEVPKVLPVQRVEDVQVTEIAGRTAVQVVRRKRKANAGKRGRPYYTNRTGLQLAFGF